MLAILPALISTITTVLAYTLLFAGVYKLFTISADLSEIKDLLKSQKRDRELHALAHGAVPEASDPYASISG